MKFITVTGHNSDHWEHNQEEGLKCRSKRIFFKWSVFEYNVISQVNTKRGNSVEQFRSTTLNQKNTFVNFTNRT